MCVCVCVFVAVCVALRVVGDVRFSVHDCVAHFVGGFVVFSVPPIDVWCCCGGCVPSVVHPQLESVHYSAKYRYKFAVFEENLNEFYDLETDTKSELQSNGAKRKY